MKILTLEQEKKLEIIYKRMLKSFNKSLGKTPEEIGEKLFIMKTTYGVPPEYFLQKKWEKYLDKIFEMAKKYK